MNGEALKRTSSIFLLKHLILVEGLKQGDWEDHAKMVREELSSRGEEGKKILEVYDEEKSKL